MNRRRLIDTNIIVRHLVQDHEAHSKAAGKMFEACDRGEVTLVVLPAVLAEAVFVLESFYDHSRTDIARTLAQLIASAGVHVPDKPVHQAALAEFGKGKLHFVDCELAAFALEHKWPVASFDLGLKRVPGVSIELD